MRIRSAAGLGLTLGLCLGLTGVRAGDFDWNPTSAPPSLLRTRDGTIPMQPLGASLGRPIPASAAADIPVAPAMRVPSVKLGAPLAQDGPIVRVASRAQPVYRAQAPDAVVPPPPAVAGAVPPPPIGGGIPGGDLYNGGAVTPQGGAGNFFSNGWGQVKGSFHRRAGQKFASDLAGDFNQFCSPVSSPFLSEDPRALTELKPLFIYQSIPNDNKFLRGGNIEFFGLQARLALTERWSIVLNKFGAIGIQPDGGFDDQSGLAEVWIGPKYTFYRDDCNKSAAAVGMTFQIPRGSEKVFQDTGDLTLSPYVSFAKGFGPLPQGYGKFNYMSTTGFAFSADKLRSDYFYSNFHIDFDVGGQNRLFPLIEFNWIRYVNKGGAVALPSEGGDLVNFGSTNLSKRTTASVALGARYKVNRCDNIQFGAAVELPLSSSKDLNDFRVLLDVIFRY